MLPGWSDSSDFEQCLLGFGHAFLHSLLVATLVGKDTYAMPVDTKGQIVQSVEAVLGPLLLGLTALAVRRRFQR